MNQERSKERGERAIDDLIAVYSDVDTAVVRTAGSVVAIDHSRFLIALIKKVERLEATLTQLLTPATQAPH